MVAGCVALVVATIGFFASALYAIYSDLKADKRAENTEATAESKIEDEVSDDKATPGEPKRGGCSPQETETDEIELSVVIEVERPNNAPNTKSPWEMLGFCAAGPEITQDLPVYTRDSDEVAKERAF